MIAVVLAGTITSRIDDQTCVVGEDVQASFRFTLVQSKTRIDQFSPTGGRLESLRGNVILAESCSCQLIEIITAIDQSINTLGTSQSALFDFLTIGQSKRIRQSDIQEMLNPHEMILLLLLLQMLILFTHRAQISRTA